MIESSTLTTRVFPKLKIPLLACVLVLSGCEAFDCIVNNHPEFSAINVRTATLNQVFEDTIKVSISNSYMDNDYWHTFELEGELPPGISYETTVREITFSGTPTKIGDYPFRLTVISQSRDTNLMRIRQRNYAVILKVKICCFQLFKGSKSVSTST